MKKILFFFVITIGVILSGCSSNKNYIEDNLSEITYITYRTNVDDFYCNISYGKREKNYVLDGKSGEKVNFCLVTFYLYENIDENYVPLTVIIDEKNLVCNLEKNPYTYSFMIDLERKLSGNEDIKINWKGNEYNLAKQNYKFDYKNVLKKMNDEYENEINECLSNKDLNAEFYLKVIDMTQKGLDRVYWCFSIIRNDNQNYNCLIDMETGEIVSKNI